MKVKPLILASALLVIGTAGLYAFQATTVTISPALPSTVYVNSTTTVTITAQITDSLVIPNGVNLLQIDPVTGLQTVVGSLSPKGQTFTITIQPPTAVPALFSYQVSAAFKGVLRRSLSLPITVAVAPAGIVLPPDPGPAGMVTLAGIDTTGTGVRDDVARWIAVTFYNSTKTRAGATQYAQALQALIAGPTDAKTQLSNVETEMKAVDCLTYIDYTVYGGIVPSSQDTYAKVLAQQLNTPQRAQAYYAIDQQLSGSFFGDAPGGQLGSECNFNPTTLPN